MTRYEQSTYRVPVTIRDEDDNLLDVSNDEIKFIMGESMDPKDIVNTVEESDSNMDLSDAANGKVVVNVDASNIPDKQLIEEMRIKGTDTNGDPYNTVVLQRWTDFDAAVTEANTFN